MRVGAGTKLLAQVPGTAACSFIDAVVNLLKVLVEHSRGDVHDGEDRREEERVVVRPLDAGRREPRRQINGDVVNFYVHYEIDDDTLKHVLTLDTYGGDDVGSWVLLEEA